MPKYNNKVIKNYYAEYTKNVRKCYQKKEKERKELADWTKDKNHVNWDQLVKLNNRKGTVQAKFLKTKEEQYFRQQQEIEKQRDQLLFEGKTEQLENKQPVIKKPQPKARPIGPQLKPVLEQKLIAPSDLPIELPETTDDEDYNTENERENRINK
jgi:hypothetical protein